MEILPVIVEGNTKLATAFALISGTVASLVSTKIAQDCTYQRSNATRKLFVNMSALLYCHLIYLDIIDVNTTPLTEEEYKTKYEYLEFLKLFHKNDVHLHTIYDSYDFATVIINNS